jgi:Protein of unknown function (DUF5132)
MARAYSSGLLTGVLVSIAAAALAPVWRPALSRWGRPALKGAIKQGIVAYAVLRERAAEMGENMSDVLAEAQVELASESGAEADNPPAARSAAD